LLMNVSMILKELIFFLFTLCIAWSFETTLFL
jgi:hypothetical protein